jgi:hypothetical protein
LHVVHTPWADVPFDQYAKERIASELRGVMGCDFENGWDSSEK